jgi:hypothetical protein
MNMHRIMPDGTIAFGPSVVLDLFEEVLRENVELNNNAKFQPGSMVQVTASFDELVNYYMSVGETDRHAKTHALQILGRKGYNIGENIGATKCEDGIYYTLELPLIPMEFLPERFVGKL